MGTVHKLSIRDFILEKATALGNSEVGLREICSDLINANIHHKTDWQRVADGTFLSVQTLKRMSLLEDTEDGSPYRPQADTCERILRYFGAELTFNTVKISPKYQNAPKDE